ncbi:MAG: sigma-70 family RNA polymerase sigma factor [Phycisphaerales bacterium]|nr:MAG: sigma-70 family RNA polymerase sigma factor [Phycisphaerales bacterium]
MFEDEVLKWKFKRGSNEALTRIYEKYLDSMLTLAVGLSNNASVAEDVVQDVFVSLVQSRRTLRVQGSLSGYLATSVVNRMRDYRRRQRRNASKEADLRVSAELASPDQAVILSEQAKLLTRAVTELPEEQREAVLLRLKAGMKFRDIAKLQQTSINTVLSRHRYGLERLRSMLDGEVKEWNR